MSEPAGPVVDEAGEAGEAGGPDVTRGLLAALIGAQLGLHGTMAGVRMAAPLQSLRDGHSALAVGLLMSLFAVAPVLLALPAGRMADRHGYHRPMRLAMGLALAGVVLAVASTWLGGALHFGLLCAAAALTGSASNIGLIAIQRAAGLMARNPLERMRIFSWLGMAPPLSNVVGPVSVGFMIDAAGFRAGYALLLVFPLLAWAFVRQVPARLPGAAPAGAGRRRGKAWDLLALPGMKRLMVVNWLLSACWDVHTFAVPVLGHELGFSASTIGLVLGSFTLSVTGVRLLIPLLAHRMREVTMLRGAMLGTALVFAAYPWAGTPAAMMPLALLLGLALGSVQPMIMSTLHQLTPDTRHGEAIALRSMVMNLSGSVMPLAFGAAGAVLGVALLFWVMGAAVGAGSWLAARLETRLSP